jgi:hypothetical protein
MLIKADVDISRLRAAIAKAKDETVKKVRLALEGGLQEVQLKAKDNHIFKNHTGNLEKSVQVVISKDRLVGKVHLDTAYAPYAAPVHEGSKRHKINAKAGGYLHFVASKKINVLSGNGFKNVSSDVFRKQVDHPGYKGDPFLYRAFRQMRSTIMDKIEWAVFKATDDALGEN